MEYISAGDAGVKWGMGPEQVEEACRHNRIPGAVRQTTDWMIPLNAGKPSARRCPFLSMTDLYAQPGCADRVAESLLPDDAALFRAEIAYYRGEIGETNAFSRLMLNQDAAFDTQIGTGMILSLSAMYLGDLRLWNEALAHIAAVPCQSREEEQQRLFWTAAACSALYDTRSFPAWFQRGSFEYLPADAYPSAFFFYIKQLLVHCQVTAEMQAANDGELNIMRVIPAAAEPLISQVRLSGALLPEIYLRLLCAVGWHDCGDDGMAVAHLDRAISLALPDRLYSPFAEYRRQLHYLMDDRLRAASPDALNKVRALNKRLLDGWIKLHNAVLDRTVSSELTVREYELARLAAYGLSNQQIAERMHLTVGSVKQILHRVMGKTGVRNRGQLKAHL